MKIILDTNILIYSEDFVEIPTELQELQKIFKKHGVETCVHPQSFGEIQNDKDEKRKKVMLSKFNSYPSLENPPRTNQEFTQTIGRPTSDNEKIDNEILYALYRNCAHFLITEDKEILRKAEKLGLGERVFTINSAVDYFRRIYDKIYPKDRFLKRDFVYNLDINDSFFDSLKKEYKSDFIKWFEKISSEGRECWVYKENNEIKALLISKEENEPIELINKIRSAEKRLKICTFKVGKTGFKLGESLLKIAFAYCIKNQINETYLTHFIKENDQLVELLEDFGFEDVGKKTNNENVYLKIFSLPQEKLRNIEISKKYYPAFKTSIDVEKYIIPIKPSFHERLFPEYSSELLSNKKLEITEVDIPGNTIKKAYLSHSSISKLNDGSIILFYRSKEQKITNLGIVETSIRTKNIDEIINFIGKRTVYNIEEIKQMAKRPVLCVLFRHHFFIEPPIDFKELQKRKILLTPPQSITKIKHENYIRIKELGGIPVRYIIN